MSTNDLDYYRAYYKDVNTYKGEDWKHTSRMLVFQDWLRQNLKRGDRVLDIGCGDAIFSELMPEFEWHGIDINTEKASGRIKKERLITHDLMQAPYPLLAAQFDAVVCSEVLEHLWDLRVVHKEAKRLLKREGIYVISTPNHNWLANLLEGYRRDITDFTQSWTIEHIRNYTFDSHKKFLNEVGFVVDKHTGADGHFDPVTSSICKSIYENYVKHEDKYGPGYGFSVELLHQWAGEGIPHVSHTTIISARKA